MRKIRRSLPITLIAILTSLPLPAYSVLTHEAIIDDSWSPIIQPLLLKRFPGATEDELVRARAFAYGGAVIQDMGYYPLGSKFFSDLTHYVRGGDFILALIREAQDLNEYAFALGAAAHYAADNEGHRVAINRTVPLMYPKLRAKFGNEITYEDNPAAHLKMEFAFDVVQVARGRYKPQAYHDFIGFQVSKSLLERAFRDTYSLDLDHVFKDIDRALATYRFAVGSLIPEMTKTAWAAKKEDIAKLQVGVTQREFIYRPSRTEYQKEWNQKYDRPGVGARFLAFLFRLLPKVGPLKALGFKVPTPQAEKLFLTSLEDAEGRYRTLLSESPPRMMNDNFDTGTPTPRGGYRLADQAYDQLLDRLQMQASAVSPELRAEIFHFYGTDGQPGSVNARAELAALKKVQ